MFSSAVHERKGVRQRSLVRGNEIQLRSLHRDMAIKAVVIKLRGKKKTLYTICILKQKNQPMLLKVLGAKP